jgi:hypothetical protein
MAAPTTLNQTTALMYEKVRSKIALLYPREAVFSDLIKRVQNDLVSTRAMRLPVQMYSGSQFAQTTFAGSDLGVGSATNYQVFQTTPIGFVQATSWSLDSQFATESGEQAVDSFVKRELKNALAEFACYTDVISQGDSTGTIDSVIGVNASPAYIRVNNPNRFRANGTYQVFSSIGGTNRGTFQVTSVDALGGVIYVSVLPSTGGATQAGDLILINGAPGSSAGTSLNGLAYIQSDPGNTGSYAGLSRASFPGMLRTPHVAANGQALTAELGRAAIQKFRLVNGADSDRDFTWYCGVDQEENIEAITLQTQSVIINQVEGKNSVDPIKFDAPKTFAGRPIKVSLTATPGRIDGLQLNHWVKSSLLPGGGDPQVLAWGGNSEFPMYGNSGGLAAATLTYLMSFWQLISDNPRAGVYIDGLPVPTLLPLGSNN